MWSVSQVLSHSANGRAGHSGEIKCHLIYEAPAPVFTWFDGSHNGMLGRMKVFGRMFVFRRIATTHVAADQAQTQVNPSVADLQALARQRAVGFPPAATRCNSFVLLSVLGGFTKPVEYLPAISSPRLG